MSRPLVIVALGEILLRETAEGAEATGLAARVALAASRLGHTGTPVSRLGQDDRADAVLAALRGRDVCTEHVQSDPDLATGRAASGPFGASRSHSVTLAHDNLQWDYDLTDLAQRTDVAIYGLLASRAGQTRSVIQQFLAECGDALRVVDATNRPDGDLDRSAIGPLLSAADIAIVSDDALRALIPGFDASAGAAEAIRRLARQHDLALIVEIGDDGGGRSVTAHAEGAEAVRMPGAVDDAALPVALVSVLAGLRQGSEIATSLGSAAKAARSIG
jgi:sugar/nucleoside kinase (ribokinase family)